MKVLDATSSTNQPCEFFGLHKNLAVMEELYNSEMAIFFANTGRKLLFSLTNFMLFYFFFSITTDTRHCFDENVRS